MALAFEETGAYHKYSVSTPEPCALALFAITHTVHNPLKKMVYALFMLLLIKITEGLQCLQVSSLLICRYLAIISPTQQITHFKFAHTSSINCSL